MDEDAFQQNISGVRDLVESGTNKTNATSKGGEGVVSEYIDILDLPMSDEKLLELSVQWTALDDGYSPKIKPRQDKNKIYYVGRQNSNATQNDSVISSNLIFEAEETYIPQALSKNPEPVVWSDNTEEGKAASNDIKTMLQFHADTLCLRRKLGVMVRHHEIYFLAIVKHGWDTKTSEIKTEVRKPQNFRFDPDGYIDEYGNYVGRFLGEKIECSGEQLIEMFPEHTKFITEKCNEKLGTSVVRTEWWTDEYCFTTFYDKVLDKHKNEYFNYGQGESATPGQNHFATPKMPYTFLAVYTLQEHPHDVTSLIEQSIPNQNRINDRDEQITKNLASGNNGVALSGVAFNSETAAQAVQSFYEEGFLLVPNGDVDRAVKRIPASPLPAGVLESQQVDKDTLRTIYGTQGLTAQAPTEDTTARGMILNQSHDSSRIGGGMGDALEQVADNIFNWWLQLYYVFYDEPHYGAIMGSGRAVEFVQLLMTNQTRHFVVSVSPNSMQPKDEITEQNLAIDLWTAKAIDPITLFKKLNYPDPLESAKMAAIWATNPQLYIQMFFPEAMPQQPQDSANPQAGQTQNIPGTPPETLSEPPANASLSQVPLPK